MRKYFNPPMPMKGEKLEVVVSHATSPDSFYVQLVSTVHIERQEKLKSSSNFSSRVPTVRSGYRITRMTQ